MCALSLSLIHGIFMYSGTHTVCTMSHITWKIWIRFSFSIWFITFVCVCVRILSCNVAPAQTQHNEYKIYKRTKAASSDGNKIITATTTQKKKKKKKKLMLHISKIALHSVNSYITHWHTITRDSHAWLSSHAFLPSLVHSMFKYSILSSKNRVRKI